MLARNCCTPVDYWLSMTLAELQVWIDANNGLFDKCKAFFIFLFLQMP